MDKRFSSTDRRNKSDDSLPPIGKEVRVIHEGRGRLAYRDSEGNWRDHYDGNVLTGELRILKSDWNSS